MLTKEDLNLIALKDRQEELAGFMKLVFAVVVFSTLPDVYYKIWPSTILLAVGLCLMSVIYYFNSKGYVSQSSHALVFLFSIVLFINSSQVGFSSFVFLYYLPLISITPFIVNYEKKFLYYIHILHPIVFIAVLFATDFSLFAINHQFAEQNKLMGSINLIFSLVLSYYVVLLKNRYKQKSDIKYDELLHNLSIQNEQLQKTNNELDRFVYSVSHDLRAPIASSLGLVELSKGETDIEKLRHYNLLKERTLRRLDDYVNSLLNFSRNYRIEIGRDEIDFNKIIEECVAFNKPYGNNESKLVVKIDVNQTGLFLGDNLRLRIIFNNLISNALKYHNEKAQEQLIAIAVSTDEKKAIIKVRDNGIGIATPKLDKVFDMFYRASETAKGSGLGLYITKEIIDKLGGKITVDSILGSGTTFVVELPNYKNNTSI